MHPNPIYRSVQTQQNLEFAKARAFGVLSINGADAPLMAHVPFLVEEDRVWLHLVRSNPIARALKTDRQAVIAVSGPDSYISPDWYEALDQVPTWNYVAVHLRGTLHLCEEEALRDVLDRESAFFERQLAPKSPWTADKMTPDALEKMMRHIVPCVMSLEDVAGTWKLNQNKPDDVRLRAADKVEAHGIGTQTTELAALMRDA